MGASRSRVWLRVGERRVRGDRIVGVDAGAGVLVLRVTGMREPLELVVEPTPPAPGAASGPGACGRDWADELLRVIERAAAWDTGTLIEFEGSDRHFAAGHC
ncbi:hypothetical protein ACW4TU_44815 [Streptomyces sp. QTS52]